MQDKNISSYGLQLFIQACENIGQDQVIEFLKEMKNDYYQRLKIYITMINCSMFQVKINKIYHKNIRGNDYDCRSAIAIFYEKYLKMNNKAIQYDLNISQKVLYNSFQRINSLNPKLVYEKSIIEKLDVIEEKIDLFVNKLNK